MLYSQYYQVIAIKNIQFSMYFAVYCASIMLWCTHNIIMSLQCNDISLHHSITSAWQWYLHCKAKIMLKISSLHFQIIKKGTTCINNFYVMFKNRVIKIELLVVFWDLQFLSRDKIQILNFGSCHMCSGRHRFLDVLSTKKTQQLVAMDRFMYLFTLSLWICCFMR